MDRRLRILVAAALSTIVAAWGLPAAAQTPEPLPRTRTSTLPEEFGLVDVATGVWHLMGLSSFFYGNPGDRPFMGDWDCDDVDTPGLYRQSDGFVYVRISNSQGIAERSFFLGDPGDVPLAGDFDGDGCDSVSLYRPSEGRFYVIDELGSGGAGLGAAEAVFTFGNPGDYPLAGDFDGDGVDEFGVYRPSTEMVHLRFSPGAGPTSVSYRFPVAGDIVIAGDWLGRDGCVEFEMACLPPSGGDTLALYRPAEQQFFLTYSNTSGPGQLGPEWGDAGWMPVSGRFVLHPADVVRERMLGSWSGTLSWPDLFSGLPPVVDTVSMEFRDDGTYAVAGGPEWASGGWAAERIWLVEEEFESVGYGLMDLYYPTSETVTRVWVGNIEVSASTLSFSFYHQGLRREVTAELTR